jgi:hypothetical protein
MAAGPMDESPASPRGQVSRDDESPASSRGQASRDEAPASSRGNAVAYTGRGCLKMRPRRFVPVLQRVEEQSSVHGVSAVGTGSVDGQVPSSQVSAAGSDEEIPQCRCKRAVVLPEECDPDNFLQLIGGEILVVRCHEDGWVWARVVGAPLVFMDGSELVLRAREGWVPKSAVEAL